MCCTRRGIVSDNNCVFPRCNLPDDIEAEYVASTTSNADSDFCFNVCFVQGTVFSQYEAAQVSVFEGTVTTGSIAIDSTFVVSSVKDAYVVINGIWSSAYHIRATEDFACLYKGTVDDSSSGCVLHPCSGDTLPDPNYFFITNSPTSPCYINCFTTSL